MASTTHIVLFDIDGTLLLSGGAGVRALDAAFFDFYGVRAATRDIIPHGMTDALICEALFEQHLSRSCTPNEYERLLVSYLEHLSREVFESTTFRLMPGIPGVLDKLSRMEGVILGLGTGNIEQGARIKLERAGLNAFFPLGGFGCDAAQRADLLDIGFQRGEARAQAAGYGSKTIRWVVGDTRLDVEAGRACGARTIAVATGGNEYDELAEAMPDYLFYDFADETTFPVFSEPF